MFKFSLKFDNDTHSLTSTDGISMDKIGELLANLFDVISPKDGSKCTLGAIRGNCYALDFFTEDESFHTNFIIAHRNIEQHLEIDLKDKERRYAKTLNFILGDNLSLQAFDNSGLEIVKIKSLDIQKEIKHYYVSKSISGIIAELGGRDLTAKPHVFINGQGYKIYITSEQDLKLKPYYKTDILNIRLRQKISSKDGHVLSATLLDFRSKKQSLIENLDSIDVEDLKCLDGIENNDDVLKRYYDPR